MMEKKKYREAISLYNKIAEDDSGSVWATKSRFAVGYIYENMLSDKKKAIDSYTILAKEYPATEQGKIAKYKIAEPPKEVTPVVPDTTQNTAIPVQAPPDSSTIDNSNN